MKKLFGSTKVISSPFHYENWLDLNGENIEAYFNNHHEEMDDSFKFEFAAQRHYLTYLSVIEKAIIEKKTIKNTETAIDFGELVALYQKEFHEYLRKDDVEAINAEMPKIVEHRFEHVVNLLNSTTFEA